MSNEALNPYQQFLDATGDPLGAGTLTFNVNLTATKDTIYSDEALTIAQANPYTLDAAGRITADVRYQGLMRIVVKDSAGAVIRTLDNVGAYASPDAITTVANYAELRARDSSRYTDGDVVVLSDDLIYGSFIIKTGTVIDDAGTLIVFTDDGNRYAERKPENGVNPLWFGALADDSTDDSTAFIAAQAAAVLTGHKSVYVPYGLYVIDGTVDILGGVTWVFNGGRLRNVTDTVIILRANGVDDWSIIGSIELKGTLTTTGSTAETGLSVFGALRCKIENVTARLFQGTGINIDNDGGAHTAERGQKVQWSNCAAYECTTGWNFNDGQSAEYHTLATCSSSGCVTGVIVQGGNLNWNGGNVTDNGTGISLISGANEAHGQFNGLNINHNDISLSVVDIILGHRFTSCNWYGDSASLGKIYIENSKGIVIDGGDWDCRVEVQDGGATTNALNTIRNMSIVGTKANLFGDDLINLRSYGHYNFVKQDATLWLGNQPELVSSFSNSWVNTGSRNAAGYWVSSDGMVHLQGSISSGTLNTAAFTIPYVPESTVELICTSNAAPGYIVVSTGGVLTPVTGDNTSFSLEGLSYRIKT